MRVSGGHLCAQHRSTDRGGSREAGVRWTPLCKAQKRRPRRQPRIRTCGIFSLAVPKIAFRLGAPSDFDRCAILASLHRPQDALRPRFYWTSDKLDQLFEQSMALDLEADNAKVIELCMEMEKLMLDEMVIVPVYEIPTKVLYESNIELPAGGYIIGWGFGNMYMTMTEK